MPDARKLLTAAAQVSVFAEDLSAGVDYLIGCEVLLGAWHATQTQLSFCKLLAKEHLRFSAILEAFFSVLT
jgi:hypothetical protein